MIKVAVDLQLEGVELKNAQLSVLERHFTEQNLRFARAATLVHRKSVFQVLIRLIRLTNVDTGRLRASWTPMMDRYGFQNYTKYMASMPLDGVDPDGPRHFSQQAVAEGKTQGFYIDSVLDTTVGTNVDYAQEVDGRSGFLTRAIVWGREQYRKNFDRFFEAAAKQGWIPANYVDSYEGD